MLVGPTVQECVSTNLRKNNRSLKGVDYKSFSEDWIAQDGHLPSVPMHTERQGKPQKERKRTMSMRSKDARKEKEQAHPDHLQQEGSHLNEIGRKDEC